MLELEKDLNDKGYKNIACIDEVGRGCLFGDVLACAIIMPAGLLIQGVKDSKKLSQKKREEFYNIILDNAIAIGIGRVNASTIDEINIKQSTRLAMKFAVDNLKNRLGDSITPDYILIDAEEINTNIPQEGIIKGDDKSHGIACASIVAKVYRDRLCLEWDKEFPVFNIAQHKGYGTKEHRDKIAQYGPSYLHRHTFLKNIKMNF